MPESLIKNIEALLNRLLGLDPHSKKQLAELAGKTIRVNITDLELSVVVEIQNEAIKLGRNEAVEEDVSIGGRLVSLTGLVMQRSAAQVFPKEIEIRGDVHLAQDFHAILKGLQIDWEETISHWTGDTVARKLGNLARANRRWLSRARDNIRKDLSEYLRFEIEMLPDSLLVEEFNRDVDALRDDMERLQQRIRKLEQLQKGETH